jgi:hypothetical protein
MSDPGPYAPDDVTEDDFDLQQMPSCAGEQLSVEFLSKCERRSEFFNEQGTASCFIFLSSFPPPVNCVPTRKSETRHATT